MSQLSKVKTLIALAVLGAAGVGGTFAVEGAQRFWANWLVWFLFIATIGLGSLFIVALEHLVGARWSVPIRRVPERLASLVLLAIPVGVIALGALPALYPWAHEGAQLSAKVTAKLVWLNVPFFSGRAIGCLLLWAVAWLFFVRGSLRQDTSHDHRFTIRAKRFAPLYMFLFALSVTLLAFDWVSALEPEWYSDIFGVYIFAGSFLGALAASVLCVLGLKDRRRLDGVRADHVYNLGGFLFAFTVFWSYIGFAQYMLMWYANMPEEVYWYKARIEGPWMVLFLTMGVCHFIIPFFALVPRDAKSDPKRLRFVATLMLAAHLFDLYWLVFPSVAKTPLLGWPELSFAAFFLGVAGLWLHRAFKSGRDMPVGDPFLAEGLEFHL